MVADIKAIVLISIVFTGLYILGTVVYRLAFHPLAKYPGPLLAKVTGLYDTYHCFRGDRQYDQLRCQKEYGPIFRYGPNYLVVNTAEGVHDIYDVPKNANIQKADNYKVLHDGGATSIHSAIDKDVHATKRKALSHGFSEQALKGLEEYMISNIRKWLDVLIEGAADETKGWTSAKNMTDHSNWLTFDILGDLCFGQSFDLITSPEHREIPQTVLVRVQPFFTIGSTPFISLYKFIDERKYLQRIFMPGAVHKMSGLQKFVGGALQERLAHKADVEKNGGEERKDFIRYVASANPEQVGQDFRQSLTFASAFYYLTKHPEIAAKLSKELREAFGDVEDIVTGPVLNDCHFLRAVIEETLRISPSVPSSIPREVTGTGITISGEYIPAGVKVGTSPYGIQHSPEYFPEPHVFRPERWFPEHTDKEQLAIMKKAFCPFVFGSRGCIGRVMAYNELSLALGRVFWSYDVRRLAGDRTGEGPYGEFHAIDYFVCGRNGPMCQFRKRAG